MSIKNTYAGQIQAAWQRGYATGRAGNKGASEPYLDGGFTAGLVRNWRDGYQQGLAEWRAEELQKRRGEQAAREVNARTELEAAKRTKGRAV